MLRPRHGSRRDQKALMAVRELRLIGDPVLRSPTRPVTRFDDILARLVDDLLDTVQLPGRAGPGAPQIGIDLAARPRGLPAVRS